jgi:hypothetical protein
MKTFSIPITSLVLGLVLMVMALWLGISPNIVSARSVFGGYESAEGCNCVGTLAEDCGVDCGGWALTTCFVGGSGPATCFCATPENKCDDIDGCYWCDAACGT